MEYKEAPNDWPCELVPDDQAAFATSSTIFRKKKDPQIDQERLLNIPAPPLGESFSGGALQAFTSAANEWSAANRPPTTTVW